MRKLKSTLKYRKLIKSSKNIDIYSILWYYNKNDKNGGAIWIYQMNTKLRDHYPSLDALCEDMELDKKQITEKLEVIGYKYKPERNQFV